MIAKILKIVSGLLAAFMSIFGVSTPANALIPGWPASTFGNIGVFDSETATTNSSDLNYFFGGSSGDPKSVNSITVELTNFDSTGFPDTVGLTQAFNSPSDDVTVGGKIQLILPSSSFEATGYVTRFIAANRIQVEFFVREVSNQTPLVLNDSNSKATVVLKQGQITSLATAQSKIVSIVGNFGGQQIGSLSQIWPMGGGGGGTNNSETEAPAPAKYSGPEFSALSGMGIMTGSTGKLEGKRLNEISSIEIGGKAATFTATSDEELELALPAGLAPGLYDLVINSSAGKLTHMNAIQVREPKKSFSITTRSTGKISNDQYIEHSLIAAMQIPELNKARCVVNANSIAMARAMANRLCAVVKASNPNIETTIVEPRSTVKGDAVFARVSYGWN
jgi:hypothetical protein